MQLAQALRIKGDGVTRPVRLALTGAGGKTTALFHLARDLMEGETRSVLVTATTHLASEQLGLGDHHFVIRKPGDVALLEDKLLQGVVLLTGPPAGEPAGAARTSGVDANSLERVLSLAQERQISLLVEADGSRRLPLKAPANHEPAVPAWVDTVVVVAGLSALGRPLSTEWVHRPERFAELSGLSTGARITPASLGRVLCSQKGGLKNIPETARRVALLNQADTAQQQAQAFSLAKDLLSYYQAVLVAALAPPPGTQATRQEASLPGEGPVYAAHEPVAGIILAAGASRRLGQPKQLLPWRGEPMVRHVARNALAAGLSPVVAVCGAYSEQVQAALADLPISLVYNPDWEAGQSTSVVAGLRSLPPESGAAVFLLVDQPQVNPNLIRSLVELHAYGLSPLVAPQAGGRRANPVLFDRLTFPDLMSLSGDSGGRALFSRYKAVWLPWHDESLLLDVDTPEDYRRLLELGE